MTYTIIPPKIKKSGSQQEIVNLRYFNPLRSLPFLVAFFQSVVALKRLAKKARNRLRKKMLSLVYRRSNPLNKLLMKSKSNVEIVKKGIQVLEKPTKKSIFDTPSSLSKNNSLILNNSSTNHNINSNINYNLNNNNHHQPITSLTNLNYILKKKNMNKKDYKKLTSDGNFVNQSKFDEIYSKVNQHLNKIERNKNKNYLDEFHRTLDLALESNKENTKEDINDTNNNKKENDKRDNDINKNNEYQLYYESKFGGKIKNNLINNSPTSKIKELLNKDKKRSTSPTSPSSPNGSSSGLLNPNYFNSFAKNFTGEDIEEKLNKTEKNDYLVGTSIYYGATIALQARHLGFINYSADSSQVSSSSSSNIDRFSRFIIKKSTDTSAIGMVRYGDPLWLQAGSDYVLGAHYGSLRNASAAASALMKEEENGGDGGIFRGRNEESDDEDDEDDEDNDDEHDENKEKINRLNKNRNMRKKNSNSMQPMLISCRRQGQSLSKVQQYGRWVILNRADPMGTLGHPVGHLDRIILEQEWYFLESKAQGKISMNKIVNNSDEAMAVRFTSNVFSPNDDCTFNVHLVALPKDNSEHERQRQLLMQIAQDQIDSSASSRILLNSTLFHSLQSKIDTKYKPQTFIVDNMPHKLDEEEHKHYLWSKYKETGEKTKDGSITIREKTNLLSSIYGKDSDILKNFLKSVRIMKSSGFYRDRERRIDEEYTIDEDEEFRNDNEGRRYKRDNKIEEEDDEEIYEEKKYKRKLKKDKIFITDEDFIYLDNKKKKNLVEELENSYYDTLKKFRLNMDILTEIKRNDKEYEVIIDKRRDKAAKKIQRWFRKRILLKFNFNRSMKRIDSNIIEKFKVKEKTRRNLLQNLGGNNEKEKGNEKVVGERDKRRRSTLRSGLPPHSTLTSSSPSPVPSYLPSPVSPSSSVQLDHSAFSSTHQEENPNIFSPTSHELALELTQNLLSSSPSPLAVSISQAKLPQRIREKRKEAIIYEEVKKIPSSLLINLPKHQEKLINTSVSFQNHSYKTNYEDFEENSFNKVKSISELLAYQEKHKKEKETMEINKDDKKEEKNENLYQTPMKSENNEKKEIEIIYSTPIKSVVEENEKTLEILRQKEKEKKQREEKLNNLTRPTSSSAAISTTTSATITNPSLISPSPSASPYKIIGVPFESFPNFPSPSSIRLLPRPQSASAIQKKNIEKNFSKTIEINDENRKKRNENSENNKEKTRPSSAFPLEKLGKGLDLDEEHSSRKQAKIGLKFLKAMAMSGSTSNLFDDVKIRKKKKIV